MTDLTANELRDIHALGRTISHHVERSWQALLDGERERLVHVYERAGDMAYGAYLSLLFRPVHQALMKAGLRARPRLPGEFDISREWGNEDESDQQRWMWSTIRPLNGEPLGTIVTVTFHDHTRFRLPRQPQMLSLDEVGKEAVVAALSRRSDAFGKALEFTLEYEAYLKREAEAGREG
ncbi:DUF6022 family protein [Chondromyces crocatus]|nr:DUF6022 family protein [Chondromyces crocatus]